MTETRKNNSLKNAVPFHKCPICGMGHLYFEKNSDSEKTVSDDVRGIPEKNRKAHHLLTRIYQSFKNK